MCSNTVLQTIVERILIRILTTARLVVHQYVLDHAPGAHHGTVALAAFQAVGRTRSTLTGVEFIVRVARAAHHHPIVVLINTCLAVGRTRCKAQHNMWCQVTTVKTELKHCSILR